ncbi:MAG: single-stranded-DNA-specific exonuclease RecJ, partial [Alphaproteobacteria bacterium]|nr:single-stranded-DNA-specific exonuclease RecJ [Alphaproteobacteria bacterium]
DVAGANGPPKASMLGFMIGPRINAGGRIGDAALGAKLLLTQDDAAAADVARELDRLNRERQEIEALAVAEAEAEALAAAADQDHQASIVTASEGWHPGVAGLVAARLKERFNKPAFAIAFAGETGTGSGRSIAGADLGRAVRAAVARGIALRGGGHTMSAGVTIKRGQLAEFRAFLDQTLGEAVEKARQEGGLNIDAAITAGGAQAELVHEIEKAGPFGSGQPEPVFALPSHQLREASVVGKGHIRMRLVAGDRQAINAIAFRAESKPLGQMLLKSRDRFIHVAGTLDIDRWGGGERVQMRVLDAASPEDNRPD